MLILDYDDEPHAKPLPVITIPFNKPSLLGRELDYVKAAIERGQLSGDGHFTRRCHERIRALTNAHAALLTHSCTAALEMAAILCDLAPDDEVIMPSFTFVSTANAVVLRGAIPVFVDIDRDTLNICPDAVLRAITPRTRAIFAVHYAGMPADMDRLVDIARNADLVLVEDAAQALGSTYRGRPAGSLADMGTFSFHETKNIISGEGGALTLNRPDLVERAEIIREKGTNRTQFHRGLVDRYTWVDIGSSYLPGELIAAFLLGQLEHVESVRARRLEIQSRYTHAFQAMADAGRVQLPHTAAAARGNGHMFHLRLRDRADRDAFIAHMHDHGIMTPFHYVPLHSSPAGHRLGRAAGALTVTNDVAARLVRLPMYFAAGDIVDHVIDCAARWLEERN